MPFLWNRWKSPRKDNKCAAQNERIGNECRENQRQNRRKVNEKEKKHIEYGSEMNARWFAFEISKAFCYSHIFHLQ